MNQSYYQYIFPEVSPVSLLWLAAANHAWNPALCTFLVFGSTSLFGSRGTGGSSTWNRHKGTPWRGSSSSRGRHWHFTRTQVCRRSTACQCGWRCLRFGDDLLDFGCGCLQVKLKRTLNVYSTLFVRIRTTLLPVCHMSFPAWLNICFRYSIYRLCTM